MFYKKAALTQQMLYKVVILPAHDILQCNFID